MRLVITGAGCAQFYYFYVVLHTFTTFVSLLEHIVVLRVGSANVVSY